MRINLPAPLGNISQGYMVQLLQQLTRAFSRIVTTDEAVHRIILLSPDGTSWNVTVDDAGVLTTIQNTGTTP
jgi:hypothetical protein